MPDSTDSHQFVQAFRLRNAHFQGALQPNGLMVVNLHTGHRKFKALVARIEKAFGGEVLLVGDGDCSNTVVFASKGLLSLQAKPCIPRKPARFDRETWDEMVPAFSGVVSAFARARVRLPL